MLQYITTSGLIIGGRHIIYRILIDYIGSNSLHEKLSTSPSSPKIDTNSHTNVPFPFFPDLD